MRATIFLLALGVSLTSWNHVLAAELLSETESAVVAKLPTVPQGLNRGFSIVRNPAQLVKSKVSITVIAPSFQADDWVFVFPVLPHTPGQEVRDYSTNLETSEVIDKSANRTPLRRCRIERTSDELKTKASFASESEVLLYSRSLEFNKVARSRTPVEELSEESRRVFLRPSLECDYVSEPFRAWKSGNKFSRLPREGEVVFAQRVFKTLVSRYRYLYVPEQNRTASTLCQTNATDCGGLSTLFVAVMRSEGIPARVMSGRWAKSGKDGELLDGQKYYQYHVIGEFYANGVGWVPVDPSSAVLHDRTEAKLNYFGKDPANFIVFHLDTGIEFDTELWGEYRTDYFQIPLFWVRGAGSLGDKSIEEAWTVTSVPMTPGKSMRKAGETSAPRAK